MNTELKNTCPKCKHQFNNPEIEAQPLPLFLKLFLIVAAIFVFFLIIRLVDEEYNDGKFYRRLTLKPDCEYVLPSTYEILSDGDVFIIRRVNSDSYLVKGYTKWFFWLAVTKEPTSFSSECKAKTAFKQYAKQKLHVNQFKKIKP